MTRQPFLFLSVAFLFLLLHQTILVGAETKKCDNPEDPKCPSRPHIIRCAGEFLDKNKNKLLERSELEDAIDSLPWYAKGALQFHRMVLFVKICQDFLGKNMLCYRI